MVIEVKKYKILLSIILTLLISIQLIFPLISHAANGNLDINLNVDYTNKKINVTATDTECKIVTLK